MATVTIDTLNSTRKLRDAGFNEAQAEAVVGLVACVVRQHRQDNVVTRDHFDSKMHVMDARFDKLTWMLGAVLGLAIANFAKQYF
jgi:hypothetical protein